MYQPKNNHPKRYVKLVSFLQKKGFFTGKQSREQGVILFFAILTLILVGRLFFLQVVEGSKYRAQLAQSHSSKVNINAKRGGIYAYDDAGQAVTLATNADIYTLFVDPKYVWDAQRISDIITPLLHEHFCKTYGLKIPTKEECIGNIENFTKSVILPKYQTIHYNSSDAEGLTGQLELQGVVNIENEKISAERAAILSGFTNEEAEKRIEATLLELLSGGKKAQNYVGFIDSPALLQALSGSSVPSVVVANNYYLYVLPDKIKNASDEAQKLYDLLNDYGYSYSLESIKGKFTWQDTRYVKITDNMNAQIAEKIKSAISDNYGIKSKCKGMGANCEANIPLLHGIGLEKKEQRYYPLGSFASNLVGYTTADGTALYGVEQYFDQLLRGQAGSIVGVSTPWIGEIGSNEVNIINPKDGEDVYLTINPFIQKKTENLIAHYLQEFKADSISVLIMDPFSGNVIASANAPTFNPNSPEVSYELRALTPQDSYLINDDTYVEIPIYYINEDNKLQIATYDERKTITGDKFIAKNFLGPQVFVDKNIAFPYEPGSIIKPFTVAAALDSDEITLYDFYSDPDGEVKIDLGNGYAQYIRNADQGHCIGTNTYQHALTYSCNVGIVDIAQQMKKEVFFNYMQKFGFGILTNVELAGEAAGSLDTASSAGVARFFNTSFGQGMLATPMQIAAGYSTLVNGGYYVKPRIVEKTYNHETKQFVENPIKIGAQILKPETSEKMKDALFQVVNGGLTKQFGIPGYTLGGKTGTSQIAFRGSYRSGNGWTHGSFVGMVTRDNVKYVVVIQVRRPRSNQFGEYTAGKIFGDLSKTLIEKDLIIK